jgi:hypothetical protein
MMPAGVAETQTATVLSAAYRAVSEPDTSAALLDEETADAALDSLELPRSDTIRAELLNLVNLFAAVTAKTSLGEEHTAGTEQVDDPLERRAAGGRAVHANVDRIVMASYHQIRVSFWISAVMSAVLFVVGLSFLVIAVAQALKGDQQATFAIAGLGIADFLLLFYTHPRRDIGKNLECSQRVHIVATSYLFGMGLATRHDDHALELLHRLTVDSVGLLAAGPSEPELGRPQPADASVP